MVRPPINSAKYRSHRSAAERGTKREAACIGVAA
jgi:hypothetical protein